jgi:drug/metabolite transporter (DMT)-like permease
MWMSGTITAFTAMAVAGREISFELDTFELMLYRSLIGLVLVLVIGRLAGTLHQIRRNRLKTHFFRNLAHFTGQNLWFFAIAVIPLAQVFALEFTSPIWVALLAHFALGERLNRIKSAAILFGFVGILMITRPWTSGISIGIAAAFISAIFFASTSIMTKALTRNESVTSIMFWLTGLQLVFGILCAGFDGDIALPSWQTAPWIFVVGLGGLLAHFCLTKALSVAPASIVAPIDFARLPIVALVGMILYNEALSIWVFLGAVVIFGANYANILSEKRRNPPIVASN